jgi:adenosylhomocysteine nucleosidase
VIGTTNIQHDYGIEKEDRFIRIQPGSRPSRGEFWTPGYSLSEGRVARLRQALGDLELDALPPDVDAARRQPGVHFGTILTGDCFVNSERTRRSLHEHFAAQAVEMEGGAVAQVASRWDADIPVVNVRCLSDLAGAESHLDFHAFLPVASRYASQVAHRLAPAI